MIFLEIANSNTGMTVATIAILLGIIGSIVKLFNDNRNNIRLTAKNEERLKSKQYQADIEIQRLKEDMEKLDIKLEKESDSLIELIGKMEVKIEKKLDSIQTIIMEVLAKK